MSPKQIKMLVGMSLAEVIGVCGSIFYAYCRQGQISISAGLLGLLLMISAFTGSVYGFYYRNEFKENKNLTARAATAAHAAVFLFLLFLYAAGLFTA